MVLGEVGPGIGIGWVLPANLNKQSVKLTILQIQTKPHTRTQTSETEAGKWAETRPLGGRSWGLGKSLSCSFAGQDETLF